MDNNYIENIKNKLKKHNEKVTKFNETIVALQYYRRLINGKKFSVEKFIRNNNRYEEVLILSYLMDEKTKNEFNNIISILSKLPNGILSDSSNLMTIDNYKKDYKK